MSVTAGPSDTWAGILWQGLFSTLLAGVIAGLVAFGVASFTVKRTQAGERQRARLVVSQSAALALQKVTRYTLIRLQTALRTHTVELIEKAITQWCDEMLLQRPVIVHEDLRIRIGQYGQLLSDMKVGVGRAWTDPDLRYADSLGNHQMDASFGQYCSALAQLVAPYAENLEASLMAHRADEPMPAPLSNPEFPMHPSDNSAQH